MSSIIEMTDSYKVTHWMQYKPGTQFIYSYMEPRVGSEYDKIVWMGVIPYIKKYHLEDMQLDISDIGYYEELFKSHFGYPFMNVEGWKYIRENYYGSLPVNIYQLPAGTIITPGTPCLAIENTDPKVPWITNYIESVIMHCWGMTTTATISNATYEVIHNYAVKCGETVSPVHLNDFGLRGASSLESAVLNGVGHLAIFSGTDNIPAIVFIRDNYADHITAGVSVIAAEHSTIMSWGKEHELDAYKYIITEADKRFNNQPVIISLVCDTYNWEHAVDEYFCKELKEIILNRSGKIVVRPDSQIPEEVSLKVMQKLWDTYGGTVNDKGYKVLDPHIGIIYADSMDPVGIDKVLKAITNEKFAVSNIIFGSGGGLLQKSNRDTLRFAIKLSNITDNEGSHPVCKETIGKESKAGKFDLPLVFHNGHITENGNENFTEIRARIKKQRGY